MLATNSTNSLLLHFFLFYFFKIDKPYSLKKQEQKISTKHFTKCEKKTKNKLRDNRKTNQGTIEIQKKKTRKKTQKYNKTRDDNNKRI